MNNKEKLMQLRRVSIQYNANNPIIDIRTQLKAQFLKGSVEHLKTLEEFSEDCPKSWCLDDVPRDDVSKGEEIKDTAELKSGDQEGGQLEKTSPPRSPPEKTPPDPAPDTTPDIAPACWAGPRRAGTRETCSGDTTAPPVLRGIQKCGSNQADQPRKSVNFREPEFGADNDVPLEEMSDKTGGKCEHGDNSASLPNNEARKPVVYSRFNSCPSENIQPLTRGINSEKSDSTGQKADLESRHRALGACDVKRDTGHAENRCNASATLRSTNYAADIKSSSYNTKFNSDFSSKYSSKYSSTGLSTNFNSSLSSMGWGVSSRSFSSKFDLHMKPLSSDHVHKDLSSPYGLHNSCSYATSRTSKPLTAADVLKRKLEILDRIYGRDERLLRFPELSRADASRRGKVTIEEIKALEQFITSKPAEVQPRKVTPPDRKVDHGKMDLDLNLNKYPKEEPPRRVDVEDANNEDPPIGEDDAEVDEEVDEEVEEDPPPPENSAATSRTPSPTEQPPPTAPTTAADVTKLDWAVGPGGGDDDGAMAESGLLDFDYTWAGIIKHVKKDLKKFYDSSSSSSSSSSSDEKSKKKKKSAKFEKEREKKRRESRSQMKEDMTKLWDANETVDNIRDVSKKGIYGRLSKLKRMVDLNDDETYFREIVEDGMEMFKLLYSQVTEFVKGIKISGRSPTVLHDAYDSVTTELLAMINLAELGTYMDIDEESLVTAVEDFENALKDFDRLLRSLTVSIVKNTKGSCPFQTGDKVSTLGYVGVVAYVGSTEIDDGIWVGVNCGRKIPSGNDGTYKFKRYFKCKPGQGLFAKPDMVAFHQAAKTSVSMLAVTQAVILIQRVTRNYLAHKKASKIKNAPKGLEAVDIHAINCPKDATESIEKLAKYLTAKFKDEGHKARAIYRWITENISYAVADYLAMRYPDITAEGTLKNRTSVCAGYANLFKALCDAAGVKAVYISGYSKGHQFNKNLPLEQQMRHAWNAFKANGHWYLLEITWAAGFMDLDRQMFVRQHSDFYWLTPPGEYIDGHYPEHNSWQLLAHPLTDEEFVNRVFPTTRFYELNIKLVELYDTIPDGTDGDAKIRIIPPDNIGLVTKLVRNNRQMASSYTFINRKNKMATICVKTYDPGDYILKVYGKDMNDKHSKYDLVIKYTIQSSKPSTISSFPFFWSEWGMPGHHLFSPIQGLLCMGKYYSFRIFIAEANQVMMVMGKTQIKLDREENALNIWVKANVQVEQCNEIKIAAVYTKGAKGLLRFEVEDKKKIKLIKKSQKSGKS